MPRSAESHIRLDSIRAAGATDDGALTDRELNVLADAKFEYDKTFSLVS